MSSHEVFFASVLDGFTTFRSILEETEKIKECVAEYKGNKKSSEQKLLDDIKNVIDKLHGHSIKVKDDFYKHYNEVNKDKTQDGDDDKHIVNGVNEEQEDMEEERSGKCDENNCENKGANRLDTENIEKKGIKESESDENKNRNDSVTENKEETALKGKGADASQETNNKSGTSTSEESNSHSSGSSDENDSALNNDSEALKITGSSDTMEDNRNEDIDEAGKKCNTDKEKGEDSERNGKHLKSSDADSLVIKEERPVIRVIDLNKLIEPKSRKSVQFDTSLIVISSDEESHSSIKNTENRGKLKSALKKPIAKPEKMNDVHKEETKKDKSKEYLSHLSISARCEKIKKCESRIIEKRHKRSKDDGSGSELPRLRSLEKRHKETKDDSSDTDGDANDCDDISAVKKTSPRIQKFKMLKVERKKMLMEKFRNKHGNKEDSSSKNVSKSKRYKDRHVKLSSESSELESEVEDKNKQETIMTGRKKHLKETVQKQPGRGDPKLHQKAYVRLPLVACERLKEVYLRNKDILEIKRLTQLNTLKQKKRSRKEKSSESSDESTNEKPTTKKSKVTRKNESSDGISSSEDDLLPEPADKIEEGGEKEDEYLADVAMEHLKNMDDEKGNVESDENNSDVDVPSKKKREEDKTKEQNKDVADKSGDESKIENDKSKDKNDKKHNDRSRETSDEEKNCEESKDDDKIVDEKLESKHNEKSSKADEGSQQKDEESNETVSNQDDVKSTSENNKKKAWRRDKLLTVQLDTSDSEEESAKYQKKKENAKSSDDGDADTPVKSLSKRKLKTKRIVISDSDASDDDKKDNTSSDSSEEKSKSSSNSEEESNNKKESGNKPSRRRIKRTKDSSSEDEEDKSTRKNIRKLLNRDSLSESTKKAESEEKERKARIAEKQRKYNAILEDVQQSKVETLILEIDDKTKKDLLPVHKHLISKLKPHQASGVRFMWDACFESLDRVDKDGSGCILAHCMGLGKTLQVITLAHTLLTYSEKTGVHKVMVVCPINTVLNWKAEFKQWMPKNSNVEVYELVSCKQVYERQYIVKEWHEEGGVLIIGYSMFRLLSNPDNKKISKKVRGIFQETLVDPGADLVVCDEGHLLKNEKTNLSIAMNRIKTKRRIVLTGTPLQNNLKEYWCMVQFIKPNLLGTYKEYLNRFVNPITNGQYTDSTLHDIMLMRKRSHVLHKLLDGVVQRRDYSVLEPYLPPKHEYVIFIRLTEVQIKLYKHYMDRYAKQSDGSNRTSFLFTDFQNLQRICTHPRVLADRSSERKDKDLDDEESEGSLKDFIDDRDASESSTTTSSSGSDSNGSDESGDDKEKPKSTNRYQQRKRVTRALAAQRRQNNEDSDLEVEPVKDIKKEWWSEYCDGEELDNINHSGKLFLLFQILKECEEIGDKILVFSQSLYTLNCIEYFLEKIDEATQAGETEKIGGFKGSWSLGLDYFRLDGSSSCENRAAWCNMFNNPDNIRARLFLISTKAGGLGINLVAANRVIIFDVSWNPSHDIQSIYRVYRFGQTKPCYIYRFVTYGAMEMKIYERQVTKQAISKRVIDEQQIDRHYNQNDLQELYKCEIEPIEERPIPLVPKDVLLGELLQKYDKTIHKYHLHQSLLENKADEVLNEEERKAAWEEFENEKELRKNTYNWNAIGSNTGLPNLPMNAQTIAAALTNIVRKDNPSWSEVQIKGIIPALVRQLQVQMSENDMSMYSRVLQEIEVMQTALRNQMSEAFYQQHVMRMVQEQQRRNLLMANQQRMINPHNRTNLPVNLGHRSAPVARAPDTSNVVIDLND